VLWDAAGATNSGPRLSSSRRCVGVHATKRNLTQSPLAAACRGDLPRVCSWGSAPDGGGTVGWAPVVVERASRRAPRSAWLRSGLVGAAGRRIRLVVGADSSAASAGSVLALMALSPACRSRWAGRALRSAGASPTIDRRRSGRRVAAEADARSRARACRAHLTSDGTMSGCCGCCGWCSRAGSGSASGAPLALRRRIEGGRGDEITGGRHGRSGHRRNRRRASRPAPSTRPSSPGTSKVPGTRRWSRAGVKARARRVVGRVRTRSPCIAQPIERMSLSTNG